MKTMWAGKELVVSSGIDYWAEWKPAQKTWLADDGVTVLSFKSMLAKFKGRAQGYFNRLNADERYWR